MVINFNIEPFNFFPGIDQFFFSNLSCLLSGIYVCCNPNREKRGNGTVNEAGIIKQKLQMTRSILWQLEEEKHFVERDNCCCSYCYWKKRLITDTSVFQFPSYCSSCSLGVYQWQLTLVISYLSLCSSDKIKKELKVCRSINLHRGIR